MKFDLVKPCSNCPFRIDIPAFLTQERAEEITNALVGKQQTFTCHKTTVPIDHDDGTCDMADGPNAQHCAGAMIVLEKINMPNQMMRIAERLGMYDRRKLDMNAPVFHDFEEFIEAQDE